MWRVPDEGDLAATLSRAEAEAYARSGRDGGAARLLLERACDWVRDALRSNGRVRMSPDPFSMPSGCVSKAMDYLAYDVLKRLPVPATEDRRRARESAEAYFAKVAAGDITPESWDGGGAAEEARGPSPLADDGPPRTLGGGLW